MKIRNYHVARIAEQVNDAAIPRIEGKMGFQYARRPLGELETATVHVRDRLHPRQIAREISVPEIMPRADQDKAHKMASGARIGRQPDIVVTEQFIAEVPVFMAHMAHGLA